MGAQIPRPDPCRHQRLEIGKRRDVLIRQEILPGDADMAHRPDAAPGSDDASDPWIVGLDIFALAHDPVMVKVENERHIVGKGQKIVETEADLVVLDRDQVSGRLGQMLEPATDALRSDSLRAAMNVDVRPMRMPASADIP